MSTPRDEEAGNADLEELLRMLVDADATPARAEDYGPRGGPKGFLSRMLDGRPLSIKEIETENARFDHHLKRILGWFIVVVVAGQIILANVFLFCRMAWGFGADVDSPIWVAWISATVVETVGLMAIVTRYLFPARKRKSVRSP